jgi:hypothetical protein
MAARRRRIRHNAPTRHVFDTGISDREMAGFVGALVQHARRGTPSMLVPSSCRVGQILDLFGEDSQLNVYAGEREVRPRRAPTTTRRLITSSLGSLGTYRDSRRRVCSMRDRSLATESSGSRFVKPSLGFSRRQPKGNTCESDSAHPIRTSRSSPVEGDGQTGSQEQRSPDLDTCDIGLNR